MRAGKQERKVKVKQKEITEKKLALIFIFT